MEIRLSSRIADFLIGIGQSIASVSLPGRQDFVGSGKIGQILFGCCHVAFELL